MTKALVHKATFLAHWPEVESQFPGATFTWGDEDDAGFAELIHPQADALIYASKAPRPVDANAKPDRTPHGWPPRGVTVAEPVAEDEVAAEPKPKPKRSRKKAAA